MRPPLIERMTRRHLLGAAATACLAAVGVVRAVPDPPAPPAPAPPGTPGASGTGGTPGDPPFDETYRGRRIQGEPMAHQDGHGSGGWRITVDGRQLGLMRRADGSYLSMVDHYQSYATPLAAAQGAVDELGPLRALSGRLH
ncbi:tyrosinase cofactor [Streptomyces sp. KL118A]|uniref:tyrosinase cofactor n=1 Tax=Streptomyces sp. KL118A TaxID=3045153 RepID=UPI00278BF866|nr:tyrosinase cofactor [Streptomyces sp. KL118A]